MSIENERWVPGIGDPTIIGWVIVALYFVVALICIKAVFVSVNNKQHETIHDNFPSEKSIQLFWLSLVFILILLGINKQLDIQTLFVQIGRDMAKLHGWYEYRRMIQLIFITFIGIIGISTLTILIRTYRNSPSAVKVSLLGSIILFTFILLRASSFYHIGDLINIDLSSIRINEILELGGLIIIGVGGYQFSTRQNN